MSSIPMVSSARAKRQSSCGFYFSVSIDVPPWRSQPFPDGSPQVCLIQTTGRRRSCRNMNQETGTGTRQRFIEQRFERVGGPEFESH